MSVRVVMYWDALMVGDCLMMDEHGIKPTGTITGMIYLMEI